MSLLLQSFAAHWLVQHFLCHYKSQLSLPLNHLRESPVSLFPLAYQTPLCLCVRQTSCQEVLQNSLQRHRQAKDHTAEVVQPFPQVSFFLKVLLFFLHIYPLLPSICTLKFIVSSRKYLPLAI